MEGGIFSQIHPGSKGTLLHSSLWRLSGSTQEMEVFIHQMGIAFDSKFICFQFDLKFGIKDNVLTLLTPQQEVSFELLREDKQLWRDLLKLRINQLGFHQQFKPVKKIGRGNFASVYLVERIRDGQQFAVKAFSKETAFSEQHGKECLIKQIEIMRALNSPNVLKLCQVFESENSLYMVFELLTGGQIFQKIKAKQKFKPKQVQTIVSSILRGLQEIHQKGIMHRDLKPENILLRCQDSFECVIADFGLSEYCSSEDYLYVRCGTPGYVAPEVINIKDMKIKYESICDIFSLGLIFHLLLTGKSVFKGKTYNQVLNENRSCSFRLEGAEYANVDQKAMDLLRKMLQVDPKQRISASEALTHSYFSEEDCEESGQTQVWLQEARDKVVFGQSPILTTANEERKKQKGLKRDSCVNFKMGKDNIITGKIETTGTMESGKISGFGASLLKGLKASKFSKSPQLKEN